MLTEAQKGAVREFHVGIQELDCDLMMLLRNLSTLDEYIVRNISHEPLITSLPLIESTPDTSEPPTTLKLENAQSLIKSFSRLDLCVAQLSSYVSNKEFPARLHFAILCAKGGLVANYNYWNGVLAINLVTALETWETLRKEFGASMAGDSDGLWRRMEENLTSYLFSLEEKHQAIGEVLYVGREAEAQQKT